MKIVLVYCLFALANAKRRSEIGESHKVSIETLIDNKSKSELECEGYKSMTYGGSGYGGLLVSFESQKTKLTDCGFGTGEKFINDQSLSN